MKRYLYLGLSGLLLLLGYGLWRHFNHRQDSNTSNTSLTPNEVAKVIVNPIKRTITLVLPDSIKTVTLPDRPSSVSLLKNGKLRITSPQLGTEIRPFLVGAYTLNGGRLGLGLDLGYWKRADIGIGFAVNPVLIQDTTLFIGVSYFVYSNTSFMLGLDNKVMPMLAMKVRI